MSFPLRRYEDVEVVENARIFGKPFKHMIVRVQASLKSAVQRIARINISRLGKGFGQLGPRWNETVDAIGVWLVADYSPRDSLQATKDVGLGHTDKSPLPDMPFAVVNALEIVVATQLSGPAWAMASMPARQRRSRPSSVSSPAVIFVSSCEVFGFSLSTKILNRPSSTAIRIATTSEGY